MEELRQKMMVCITTLQKLNGRMQGFIELNEVLGPEYEVVLMEYFIAAA